MGVKPMQCPVPNTHVRIGSYTKGTKRACLDPNTQSPIVNLTERGGTPKQGHNVDRGWGGGRGEIGCSWDRTYARTPSLALEHTRVVVVRTRLLWEPNIVVPNSGNVSGSRHTSSTYDDAPGG